MKVALVTTWGTACGIAEHAAYLAEAVEAADTTIDVVPLAEALDPHWFVDHAEQLKGAYDLVHLNYQAALHSRWTPEAIEGVQKSLKRPVVVTYHDTGVPNSAQCKGIIGQADAAVVHEPFDDLPEAKTHYWRMGVPGWSNVMVYDQSLNSWCGRRPILGTVGFPFPWKNYDMLARVTRENDWALLVSGLTSAADKMRLEAINPQIYFTGWQHRRDVGMYLAGCDATAFCYTCANTGQSGAVLQGIGARKPVIAFAPMVCRQFRALCADPLGWEVIRWCDSFDKVGGLLRSVPLGRVDPATVALAEQDSWERLGAKYADLFRRLVA